MSNIESQWPSENPRNIIVRMPNWLGDLVMATPILADLRHKWPDSKITAMCQSNVAPLLKSDPYIDEVFSYHRPSGWIHRGQHLAIIEKLRRGEYDLGILLTNSFSSAWWFWRGNVQNRIGYAANFRRFLMQKALSFPANRESQHLTLTYKMLLQSVGISVSDTVPKLYVTENEQNTAFDMLLRNGVDPSRQTLIGINPGAAYGSAKCWLPERFEEVTKRLLEDPKVAIVYFGDQAGAPLVNRICQNFPERVLNLAGKTSIRELMALMQKCAVILTNDSGPMHVAAALGVPLVALFGSTNPLKTGPLPKGKVIQHSVECSPCYKRVCPIDFRCMKKIEVDEVYQAIRQQLLHRE
ncbi:lipopolysaccharide heptosyltransferase II [Parachlamydia sp. AcF125]|uniref:lipopolysaccharide heptosyltransferase II n=1 Tax=Parachlamydia sp. AcF125 TaxID=2795736 RepID=UPI001BC9458F|nr:lipopolysaccharide heptosyltransferase II [Parachlamydia sp. AcF125]MBS4167606.1 ADP-heptose--LPS heptosyltransferase 2 [Parachlamydia sp. AcF125]